MRWIAILILPIASPAIGSPGSIAECFDGILPPPAVEPAAREDVGQVSWTLPCSHDPGCSDCGDATCCGEVGCGEGCGSVCGGDAGWGSCCPPCRQNNGLLGLGYLTHDPCGEGCLIPELVLGTFFRESERGFDEFISPMTNPVFFEDPRTLTELRAFFWHHNIPTAAGGERLNLYAVQIRARLTDRLSLVAAKDGYIVSKNPLIDDGWADVQIGFKYGLYRNAREQRLLSAGFAYEMPVGSTRTLQGKGGGQFHLYTSGGAKLFDCSHWLSSFGGVIPADSGESSHFMYWSNHFDYQIRRGWYGLLEFNWFHWTDGGDDTLGLTGVEGLDAFNFGSGDVNGNDIVTGAFGIKYKPNPKYEIGLAWEVPLTERRDVIDNRLTADLILRY